MDISDDLIKILTAFGQFGKSVYFKIVFIQIKSRISIFYGINNFVNRPYITFINFVISFGILYTIEINVIIV